MWHQQTGNAQIIGIVAAVANTGLWLVCFDGASDADNGGQMRAVSKAQIHRFQLPLLRLLGNARLWMAQEHTAVALCL